MILLYIVVLVKRTNDKQGEDVYTLILSSNNWYLAGKKYSNNWWLKAVFYFYKNWDIGIWIQIYLIERERFWWFTCHVSSGTKSLKAYIWYFHHKSKYSLLSM